ncbi:hypothetical protein Bca52824_008914 [Brassica carinata]|uniref:Chitin-binding type-1 domain-containing protein n=1 Tax=Brassica carinata TaxID=52824 RepID=A0A8X7WAT8_BRACI|nr:hypothetical protein Bca52824_008914 [Brassica carinata]
MCCSRYGYCGTTADYCGTGCRSGPCSYESGGVGLNAGPRDRIANVVTPAVLLAFISAAQSFPAYRGTVAKREIAAMLAQFSHESDKEIARGRYCQASSVYPCQPGKNYYGRGPIQITWNENYGAAGKFLGLPLLTDPDMVARNPDVAFKCAMWFWNEKVRPVVDQGFGATTRRINGGECDGGSPTRVQSRVNRYLEFCRQFGISPGTSLSC